MNDYGLQSKRYLSQQISRHIYFTFKIKQMINANLMSYIIAKRTKNNALSNKIYAEGSIHL